MITDQQLEELKTVALRRAEAMLLSPATILSLIERVAVAEKQKDDALVRAAEDQDYDSQQRVELARERNEALDQCAGLHEQLVNLKGRYQLLDDPDGLYTEIRDQIRDAALEEAAKVAEGIYTGYGSQTPIRIADLIRAIKVSTTIK